MKNITPIFVLGIQRSGTTWMANSLGGHPDVAAVEAEDHQGVHESIFFSHFAKGYGDLSDDISYERFVRDFTASDYFILSGIPESWFRAVRPRTYPEAFQCLMDEVARRRGARFWVEKSPHHTLLSWELADAFPGARFVCVVRDPVTLIRSRLWAFGRKPPGYPARAASLLRACAAVSLYQRHLATFAARCGRALLVSHDEMRADPAGTMKRVMEFVGADYHPAMLESRYRPNTSFTSNGEKDSAFGAADRALVRVGTVLFGCAPLGWLRRVEESRSRRGGIDWPPWCWKRRPRPSSPAGRDGAHLASKT